MDNFFLLLTGMTLWTSVTALFLHLFRRRRKDLRGFSLYGMLAVYLLCFFRSVQLADFNKSMHWDMPDFFNAFYYAIVIKKYDFFWNYGFNGSSLMCAMVLRRVCPRSQIAELL